MNVEQIAALLWAICPLERLNSAAFEATRAFAKAKVRGGSNVRCNDLLYENRTSIIIHGAAHDTSRAAPSGISADAAPKPTLGWWI